MLRARFEKKGNAIWISHLDLMRLFQRAFQRAKFPLKHTQGFNPRPTVSMALPLSVGVESNCELMDFELEGIEISADEVCRKLNEKLIPGVHVLQVYEQGKKLKNLTHLSCRITLEYDNGISQSGIQQIRDLLSGERLVVPKKTKNGIQDQDIIPMMKRFELIPVSEREVFLDCLICCQNPTLNPAQICLAIETYLPEWKPDFFKCERIETYEADGTVFR